MEAPNDTLELITASVLQGWRWGAELGHGGMGSVHLAVEPQSGARRAVKILSPIVAATEDGVLRFQREVESMAALRHPHIVRAFASGELGGVPFIVMEYCQGGSLSSIVSREGPLSVRAAVHMTRDVLDGLAYAHAAPVVVTGAGAALTHASGIVHRDLKPHNVLASTENNARRFKIADFGLAKAFELAGMSAVTRTNTMGGTPAFMPRQQAVNFKYARPEVDVWAAAACLYYALTGYPPRDFVAGRDPWLQVWTTAAVPVAERGVPLPDALCRFLDEALVDRPEIHFSTVADFRGALEIACRREGIENP